MKSLILTSLYLFKDTVYRWKERPSSPLSRLLVVFFLSLCALSFLGNYVLITKSIAEKIRLRGGDIVSVVEVDMQGKGSKVNLIRSELRKLFDVDLIILSDVGIRGDIDGSSFPVVEYGDEGLRGLKDFPLDRFPYIALISESKCKGLFEGPAVLNVGDYMYDIVIRKIPPGHMLEKAYKDGVILVPSGLSERMGRSSFSRRYLVRVKEMTYENVRDIDHTLSNLFRFEGGGGSVISSEEFLADLSLMMSNQNECRAGFSIGIAVIVGILLTALASMEFRENEYIYTLMKSFGVRPIFLVFAYIVENLFLVSLAFAGSVAAFMEAQDIIMREFFKLDVVTLKITDLTDDLALLGSTLAVCVLVSSIPIVVSAYREIGRVLK